MIFGRSYLLDDALHLQVIVDSLLSELTTDARISEPSEGSLAGHSAVGVDIDLSGPEPLHDVVDLVVILRDDASCESVVGGVGPLDDIIKVVEFEDAVHWTENFLLCDDELVLDVGEDCRLNVEALVSPSVSTNNKSSSFFLADLDVMEDAVHLLCTDLRALLGFRIEGISEFDLCHDFGDFLHILVID